MLDNGLARFTFGRDDTAGGVVSGWSDVSITATSVVVEGTELAHHLNGVDPRDPDRQHSFYVDASGGKSRLVCSEIRVIRAQPDVAEVAFVDITSAPLRHEHHLIMRSGRRGLYGYDILTAVAATQISEVRMNTRWDRGIFDHAFNWERGSGQQPTYAYLATQESVQDETWRVDGINNPGLPSPESNSGNLPPGTVYSKYEWSLYHHQNPMFGHYGHGFGVWFTPLGGVTDRTLAAFYGVGPQHQDLAIHQDALILNYFGANHYGLPGYPLPAGYRRLYGPWFTYLTTGDPADPDSMIAEAAATAWREIAENRDGADWVGDALYPPAHQRATVTGRLRLTDGRPAKDFWVLLSTQDVDDVYTIHEPTYFVKTAAVRGTNTLTLSRGAGTPAGNGLGWDTVLLEVAEPEAPAAADLAGTVTRLSSRGSTAEWRVEITNRGAGPANDVRLDRIDWPGLPASGPAPRINGPDPDVFPVPVAASIPAGGSATTVLSVTVGNASPGAADRMTVGFTANGAGRGGAPPGSPAPRRAVAG